ncbi:MAG: class I SAM-dependent methyltransferase [Agathobacter sp.]|nr:class I SAM-dependent methyltransferase [Agathobacter sp.]
MTEYEWDQKLNIDTIGRDASVEDAYHHPYEPTPYSVLVRLADSDYINEENIVVDYGCGKGRVGFFLSSQIDCKVIGIEFDAKIYGQAYDNLSGFVARREKVEFLCIGAENYEIEEADVFYFFNPFSVEILQSVIGKIKKSYYDDPREMKLFFYYPSDEYISYLMTVSELCFLDEIDCSDLFESNKNREKIMIFEMM